MASSMGKVLVVSLVVCTLAVYVGAVIDTGSGFPVPSYYVFGDAYFDGGNNNFIKTDVPMANYKPYGMTHFRKPTGRFCDGRIFPDLLSEPMKLPLAKPSLSALTLLNKATVNYASGGSAILASSSVAWGAKNALSFDQQVTQNEGHAVDLIMELGVDEALLYTNDAIYQLNFGAIDIMAYFSKNSYAASKGSIQTFLESLASEYRNMVDRLYTRGARKVVVFGLGPLHMSPTGKVLASKRHSHRREWSAKVDSAVKQLNLKLKLMVTELNADSGMDQAHASLQLVFADVYGAVTDMTNKPYRYGLNEVKNACCGGGKFQAEFLCGRSRSRTCKDVSRHLYWNGMQFTEAANKKLFKTFYNSTTFISPFSVRELAEMLIPGVPY